MARVRRIGVFGGSFDPVHAGHIGILKAAQRWFGFDWVYVVPTAQNPLKGRGASPLGRRLAGLRKALRPVRFARISLVEARRKAPCYTVDTLKIFRKRHPGAELFFICGSDCLQSFDRWKDPKGILELATVAVAGRAGHPAPRPRKGFRIFPMKPVRLSSTALRKA